MRDMDAVLMEKERLLHELVRNQRDFDTMRNAYERKMEGLQVRCAGAKRALQKAKEPYLNARWLLQVHCAGAKRAL